MQRLKKGRRSRVLFALAAVVALVALTTQSGRASTGGMDDTTGDVTGKFDVTRTAHADTGSEITYTVTFASDFAVTDVFDANWLIRYTTSGNDQFNVLASSDGQAFSGEVVLPDGSHVADATVTHSAAKTLRVVFPRSVFGTRTNYFYRLKMHAGTQTDYVPNDQSVSIEHQSLAAQSSTTSTTGGSTTSTTSSGSGSGASTTTTAAPTTTTTAGGSGSGATTTTTTGGSGSGATTTTVAGGTTTTTACAPKVVVDPSTVAAGQSVKITGTCLTKNTDDTVVLTSNPVLLGTVHTDGNGNFTANFVIPADTPPGSHSITVSGSGVAAAATITVAPRSGIGFTGRNAARAIGVAIALMFAGAVLFAGRVLGDEHDRSVREL